MTETQTAGRIRQAPTAARAAALWWAEQVGEPVFRNEETPNFAGALGALLAESSPVNDGQLGSFAAHLEVFIGAALARLAQSSITGGLQIGVDYGPDQILADAAAATRVPLARFPWKTNMTVHPDYVIAGLGYRAPMVLIWSAPSWERPPCRSREYIDTGSRYEPQDRVCGLLRYHDGDHGDWQHSPVDPERPWA